MEYNVWEILNEFSYTDSKFAFFSGLLKAHYSNLRKALLEKLT